MIEEKMKHTFIRSFKIIIIMVISIWLNHFYWLLSLQSTFSFNHPVIFPVIASGAAIILVLLLYYHGRNIRRYLKSIAKECSEKKTCLSNELLDNIGHELRNPMIGIMGSADLLGHSALDAEQISHLDTIRECGYNLLNIIDHTFNISNTNNIRAQAEYDCQDITIKPDYSAVNEQNLTYLFNQFLPVNILLVEDNDLNQKLILQMLSSYGFAAESVNNGLECLQKLQEKEYHLILMDMQMPVLDGYETTRKIRASSCYDHIPIIAITANTISYDYDKCIACGCSSYLPKPFSADELATEIKIHLKTDYNLKSYGSLSSNELIYQLLPEFIEILAEMLDDLYKATDQHDMQSIQELSHAIKGTAGMYGFMQISELAAMIEEAGRENCYSRIPRLINQMNQYHQQIINHLKKTFA